MALADLGNTIKGWAMGIGEDGQTDARDKAAMRDDAQTIADLDERYKRARDDRRPYEGEWQTNLAFLRGEQWIEWSKQRQALYMPPVPPWRVRNTTNLIQPIVRTIVGKITVQETQGKVQATNETPEAAQDARAQDELLDYLWERSGSEEASLEALKWAIVTGTGLRHPCWDKSKGDEMQYPDTAEDGAPHPMAGQPVHEPNPETNEDDGTGNVVHMGDIDDIAVSPFQFFPEPLCQKIDDMEWVFYVSVRPSSYVKRKYGQDIPDETVAADDFLQFNSNGEETQFSAQTKGVLIKEYWERQNDEHPKGRYVVYAGAQVLVNTNNPYPKLPIPFFAVRDSLIPGRFWGRSIVSDLVPLQRKYNKTDSQAAEIRNATARPKWHVFKGSLDPGKTISTAPSEVITTNPLIGVPDGGKPSKILGGDVPASFPASQAAIEGQFYEIAGLHDFRRGLQGLGMGRSFAALNLLIEQDDTRIGILKRENDRCIVGVEMAKLKLAKQFYIEPRTVTVIGPDQKAEVHEFYAEKIADDPRVEVMASGALPSSLVARQQYVFELKKEGIVQDDRTVRKLLGLADMPGLADSLDIDIRQAERENEALKKGQQVQAHDYDNHQLHGQEHDDYRKGEEYEQIAQQNPAVVQAFAQHVESHKAIIQQQLAASMQPKISLSGQLTPQQEAQAFSSGAGAPPPPAPARPMSKVAPTASPFGPPPGPSYT